MGAAKKLEELSQYQSLVHESLQAHLDWSRIAVDDQVPPHEVLTRALAGQTQHICQPSHPYFKADLNTAACMLGDIAQFIKFPLATILSPEQVNGAAEAHHILFGYEFNQIRDKTTILEGVRTSLETRGVAKSILTDVLSIADELTTNAVFNAPFVDLANTKPGAARDDQTVTMHAGQRAQIFVGADETRLAIGCRDPYGSLNLVKLFERVKKCYDTSVAESMNKSSAGGAGIGSFMVFTSSASYFAVVDEGQCTMICCVLPIKMSSRMRAELPKNLHFKIIKP